MDNFNIVWSGKCELECSSCARDIVCEILISFPLNACLEVELAESYSSSKFSILSNLCNISIMTLPLFLLPTVYHDCLLVTLSTTLVNSHLKWYGVIAHCNFDLHFPGESHCWALFYIAVGHLHFFYEKNPFKLFSLFNRDIWVFCFGLVFLFRYVNFLHIYKVNFFSAR